MNRYLSLLAIVSFLLLSISCGKENNQTSAQTTGDKDNMYRDWTKKGKRTPAPRPGFVLDHKTESGR